MMDEEEFVVLAIKGLRGKYGGIHTVRSGKAVKKAKTGVVVDISVEGDVTVAKAFSACVGPGERVLAPGALRVEVRLRQQHCRVKVYPADGETAPDYRQYMPTIRKLFRKLRVPTVGLDRDDLGDLVPSGGWHIYLNRLAGRPNSEVAKAICELVVMRLRSLAQ